MSEYLYKYLVGRFLILEAITPEADAAKLLEITARRKELQQLVAWMGVGAELTRLGAPNVTEQVDT